jgi:hypothetical protein
MGLLKSRALHYHFITFNLRVEEDLGTGPELAVQGVSLSANRFRFCF